MHDHDLLEEAIDDFCELFRGRHSRIEIFAGEYGLHLSKRLSELVLDIVLEMRGHESARSSFGQPCRADVHLMDYSEAFGRESVKKASPLGHATDVRRSGAARGARVLHGHVQQPFHPLLDELANVGWQQVV